MLAAMLRAARAFYLFTLIGLAITLLAPSLGWLARLEGVWGEGRVVQVAVGLALLGTFSEHVLGNLVRRHQSALARAIQRLQPTLRHKEAIEILIRALEHEKTRNRAHRELKRITSQDLPAEPEAWRNWLAGEEKTLME